MSIANMRESYRKGALDEQDVNADPIAQFERWFEQARRDDLIEPNAMTLATADAAGKPGARIVLLKAVDAEGFVWFTNYQSRKGQALAQNAQAALLFYWPEQERQVRVEGPVSRLSAAASDAYFASRPLQSRLGAWASPQSKVIESREVLEAAQREYAAKFGDAPPRPDHWGGFRLSPLQIEFWQGRPSRLHDRLLYRRDIETSSGWQLSRLAP